jgi:hypothetical protein
MDVWYGRLVSINLFDLCEYSATQPEETRLTIDDFQGGELKFQLEKTTADFPVAGAGAGLGADSYDLLEEIIDAVVNCNSTRYVRVQNGCAAGALRRPPARNPPHVCAPKATCARSQAGAPN